MRRLLIFSCGFMAAIALSVYLLSPLQSALTAGICIALSFLSLMLSGKDRTAYFSAALGLAVGFIYFSCYYALFISPIEDYDYDELPITAVVRSYPEERYGSYAADVKITGLGYFGITANLSSSDENFRYAEPGDVISARAQLAFPEAKYLTYGTHLSAYADKIDYTETGRYDIVCLGNICSHYISDLTDKLFSEDVLPLVKALTSGDKTDYYRAYSLNKSFARTGLSHIVAISGLHISMVLMLPGLFIRSRRRYALFAIPIVLFFMAFAGFTPSVCRAGVFHILIYGAYLAKREPDMPTCLFTAMLLILVFNPYMIQRISLQLSFCAISGILLVTDRVSSWLEEHIPRDGFLSFVLRAVIRIVSTSLGALLFTAPLIAIYFGKISAVSVLTSVLVMWVLPAAFCICIAACVCGIISLPAGIAVARFAAIPIRYIMSTAEGVSTFSGSVISMADEHFALWFGITYAVILCVVFIKKYRRAFAVSLCYCAMAMCVLTVLPCSAQQNDGFSVSALNVGQGQCIVLAENELTCVVDCGSTSGFEAGDIADEYLSAEHRDRIDYLIITHWHADHVNGITDLLISHDVRYAVFPQKTENAVYDDLIIEAAEQLGCGIFYCETPLSLSFGRGSIHVFPPTADGDENERCCAVLCSVDGYDTLITGDMPAYCEVQLLERAEIPDIELLIVGHHGSYYSTSDVLLEETKPETAIISVGVNSYGHPHGSVLEKLKARGIEINRTDMSGTITISPGG